LNAEGKFAKNSEQISLSQFPLLEEALNIGVLCNNAAIEDEDQDGVFNGVGDPTEVALLICNRYDPKKDANSK